MITRKFYAILALTLILLAGCGAESPTVSPLPTPAPGASCRPTPTLHDIVTEPDRYAGQPATVEGMLEAEGQMPNVRFFLRDGADRLEVSSWAPLETIKPPQGSAQAKSMIYYVGRRLRLSGVLEQGKEGLLLTVAAAEELQ